eukprot:3118926-Amphidinium_carterae.3
MSAHATPRNCSPSPWSSKRRDDSLSASSPKWTGARSLCHSRHTILERFDCLNRSLPRLAQGATAMCADPASQGV